MKSEMQLAPVTEQSLAWPPSSSNGLKPPQPLDQPKSSRSKMLISQPGESLLCLRSTNDFSVLHMVFSSFWCEEESWLSSPFANSSYPPGSPNNWQKNASPPPLSALRYPLSLYPLLVLFYYLPILPIYHLSIYAFSPSSLFSLLSIAE